MTGREPETFAWYYRNANIGSGSAQQGTRGSLMAMFDGTVPTTAVHYMDWTYVHMYSCIGATDPLRCTAMISFWTIKTLLILRADEPSLRRHLVELLQDKMDTIAQW